MSCLFPCHSVVRRTISCSSEKSLAQTLAAKAQDAVKFAAALSATALVAGVCFLCIFGDWPELYRSFLGFIIFSLPRQGSSDAGC